MIQFQGVSAGYKVREVLRDVSFTAPQGQITALTGPNGCGKSTLLKTACGLLRPTVGEVRIKGDPVPALSRRQLAKRAAYLPQAREVPTITVERLVAHGRYPHLGFGRRLTAEDERVLGEAMDWAGVAELAGRELGELSGGERQRVYIAMALAQDSEVLLLDEPTTYLDIGQKYEVMELVLRLKARGKTVLMVLHDLSLAFGFSDWVAVLDKGRLEDFGPAEEVFERGAAGRVFGVTSRRLEVDGRERFLFFGG